MNKYAHLAPPKPAEPGADYSVVYGCKRKVRYGTERKALSVADRRWKKARVELRVYPCPLCQGFHLTKTKNWRPR